MDLRLVLIGLMISVPNLQAEKVISRIERFDLCKCGTGESDCNVKDFEVVFRHYDRFDSQYDITFFLKSSVYKLRVEISLEKCRNKETLDNCENYGTLNPLDTCAFAKMRNTLWATTVYGIQPPYTCPLMEGEYVGKNLTFPAEKFKIFPILNSFWRMRWKMIDDNKPNVNWTLCIDGFAYKNHRL